MAIDRPTQLRSRLETTCPGGPVPVRTFKPDISLTKQGAFDETFDVIGSYQTAPSGHTT